MTTTSATLRFTPEELNRLHDRAHAQAPALRREAIDAFWHALPRWLLSRHEPAIPAPAPMRCAH